MSILANIIQNAWKNQADWLILLRPFAWLYRGVFLVQKQLKLKNAYKAPVPVMIIGNITVGGSGKTPLIITLVKYLQSKNIKVGVISRGYGGNGEFPALVTTRSLATQVGDEPVLIVQSTQVPMSVGANRRKAIELLLEQHDVELILSDDGLQHFSLQRDLEWVVVDAARGFGNQKMLPEGYLREPLSRLNSVTVIEHQLNAQSSLNMHLQVGQPFCLGDSSCKFDALEKYYAVVGIGFPDRFFQTLKQIDVKFESYIFPDHHQYTHEDLSKLNQHPIITTSKDAVKLQELWHGQPEKLMRVWVVPVEAILSELCYQTFNNQLNELNIIV